MTITCVHHGQCSRNPNLTRRQNQHQACHTCCRTYLSKIPRSTICDRFNGITKPPDQSLIGIWNKTGEPPSGTRQFFFVFHHLLGHHRTLHPRQMIDEQYAVQMVQFMLRTCRPQPIELLLMWFTINIQKRHAHLCGALNILKTILAGIKHPS